MQRRTSSHPPASVIVLSGSGPPLAEQEMAEQEDEDSGREECEERTVRMTVAPPAQENRG